MIHNLRSISLLMLTAVLTACGGGGGGGGGGSSNNSGIPIQISTSTAGKAASLVVQTVVVGESPNYNEAFPAAVVGVSLPAVSAFNLSRAYVAEVRDAAASTTVLPTGVTTPVPVSCKSGSGTKTYSNGAAGTADPITVHAVGDTLDITYTDCVIDLIKEGNNCISPTSPLKDIKLNGSVRTTITSYTSASVFNVLVAYNNLRVASSTGATDTLNGSIAVKQDGTAAPSYDVTAESATGDTLRTTSSSGETQTLSATLIRVLDTQIAGADCSTATPANNNAYNVKATSHGRVASSTAGYVDFTVNNDAVGDSDTAGGGFPDSGLITITGDGGISMTITGVRSGNASVSINGSAACVRTWVDLFAGNFSGC